MKQCFGYVRVSTQKQGEGVSLEAQQKAILAFAEQNNITITKWFEETQTAAKSGRPLFTAMVTALRAGKAEGVVMHKIDRSARNFRDWARVGDLSDAGIDVHFATESLDFRSRGGRLAADIQAVIAADYIRNLKEEVQKGIRGQLERGLYPMSAPVGYENNGGGKAKTIDPVRGPLVAKMFELYATGEYPLWSLVAEMNRRGLTTRAGRPLSKTGVEKTLNNLFYTGIIKIKRTGAIYQGVHEPLISAQLFQQVQRVKTGRAGKKITKHNHTFRGLFRCALCNAAMNPELQKGHVYYRCQNRPCPTKTVREEAIDTAVCDLLTNHKLSELDTVALDHQFKDWLRTCEDTEQQKTTKLTLANINARLDTLGEKLLDEVIDDETYQSLKKKLLLKRAAIENQLVRRTRIDEIARRTVEFLERVKSLVLSYQMATKPEKRELVKITTSNRQVRERKVVLEPQKWLQAVDDALPFLCGAPPPATSRRHTVLRDQRLLTLSQCVLSDEVISFSALGKSRDL